MRSLAIVIRLAPTLPGAGARSRATVTVADYERAEKFLNYNTTPLVSNGAVRATWMPGDRFWYRNQTANGQRVHPRRRRARPPGRRPSTTPPSPRR